MKDRRDLIAEDCKKILDRVDFSILKNKRVLVTGANGLIGQYVVSALAAANKAYRLNCRIQCVSLHGPGAVLSRLLPDAHISFKNINLAKPFRLSGNFEYIFHAAGYGQPSKFANDPSATIATNISATEILLNIAERSRGTFIFFSSAEVYGEMPASMASFREEFNGSVSPEGPRAVYAAAKRLGEALVLFFEKHRGVRVKIVRISAVYGPGASGSDTRVMSDFIRKALSKKRALTLLDEGASVRTYGYLADVAAMIFHTAFKGTSTIYNVGGKDTLSIRELAEQIGAYCGASVHIPHKASRAYFVGRDPKRVKLDLSKIKKEMKRFSFTPFRTGLANTIEWTRQK